MLNRVSDVNRGRIPIPMSLKLRSKMFRDFTSPSGSRLTRAMRDRACSIRPPLSSSAFTSASTSTWTSQVLNASTNCFRAATLRSVSVRCRPRWPVAAPRILARSFGPTRPIRNHPLDRPPGASGNQGLRIGETTDTRRTIRTHRNAGLSSRNGAIWHTSSMRQTIPNCLVAGTVLVITCLAPPASADDVPNRPRAVHWSFQPPQRPTPPDAGTLKHRERSRNPIDQFVFDRLQKSGLDPAGEAKKRTLVRRAHFDLLGLPPSPEETATPTTIQADHETGKFFLVYIYFLTIFTTIKNERLHIT